MTAKNEVNLTAKIEVFDSFWEAPEDIEKGYSSFAKFYRRNYIKNIKLDNIDFSDKILVVCCGPGYFINLLNMLGYKNVLGIDSDENKVAYAQKRKLNCNVDQAFLFLERNKSSFKMIFVEQEINHLTKDEIIKFLKLCHSSLLADGILVIHSLNGANPITGAEALAQNYDHFNTFTAYSLRQVLEYCNFKNIKIFPLNLYIFYENPFNYIGFILERFLNIFFKIMFIFYGKNNSLFSKKIAAVCRV